MPPKKKKTHFVGEAEAAAMFDCHIEGMSYYAISQRFNRSNDTVNRLSKKNNWRVKSVEVREEREKIIGAAVADKAAGTKIDDIRLIEGLMKRVFSVLLDKINIIEPKVSEAVALIRLHQELMGNIPPEQRDSTTVNLIGLTQDLRDEIIFALQGQVPVNGDGANAGGNGDALDPSMEVRPT